MTNFAVVDQSTGTIINRIVLDDGSTWSPEEGHQIVEETGGDMEIGATYVDGVYTPLPKPPVPPPPPVVAVTPRQARLALLQAGILDQVEAAVTAAGGSTKISWEYATQINRNDELIATLGTALGLTSTQIDDLFQAAASL